MRRRYKVSQELNGMEINSCLKAIDSFIKCWSAHWQVLVDICLPVASTEVTQLPFTVMQSGNLCLWQAPGWWMLKHKQKEMTFWLTWLFRGLAPQIKSVKTNQFMQQHILRKIVFGNFTADVIFSWFCFESPCCRLSYDKENRKETTASWTSLLLIA